MSMSLSRPAFAAVFAFGIAAAGCHDNARTMSPAREAPADPSEPSTTELAEGNLEEVELRSGDAFELTLTVGGSRYHLSTARPYEENLEGVRIEIPGVAGIHARVTCLDAGCTSAETHLLRDGKIATIHSESRSIGAEIGQVRDGCEIPLFFEEDYAALYRFYPGFEPLIDEVHALRNLDVSRLRVTGWSGERFETLELSAHRVRVRAREDASANTLVSQVSENGSLLDGMNVSIRRAVPGDSASLTDLTFELLQPGVGALEGMDKRICVDLRVLPPLR